MHGSWCSFCPSTLQLTRCSTLSPQLTSTTEFDPQYKNWQAKNQETCPGLKPTRQLTVPVWTFWPTRRAWLWCAAMKEPRGYHWPPATGVKDSCSRFSAPRPRQAPMTWRANVWKWQKNQMEYRQRSDSTYRGRRSPCVIARRCSPRADYHLYLSIFTYGCDCRRYLVASFDSSKHQLTKLHHSSCMIQSVTFSIRLIDSSFSLQIIAVLSHC